MELLSHAIQKAELVRSHLEVLTMQLKNADARRSDDSLLVGVTEVSWRGLEGHAVPVRGLARDERSVVVRGLWAARSSVIEGPVTPDYSPLSLRSTADHRGDARWLRECDELSVPVHIGGPTSTISD